MMIKKGQIVALTVGEYSDYCLRDHVKAIIDFDTDAAKEQYMNDDSIEYPAGTLPHSIKNYKSVSGFISWMIKNNFVTTLDDEVVEYWIGYDSEYMYS